MGGPGTPTSIILTLAINMIIEKLYYRLPSTVKLIRCETENPKVKGAERPKVHRTESPKSETQRSKKPQVTKHDHKKHTPDQWS